MIKTEKAFGERGGELKEGYAVRQEGLWKGIGKMATDSDTTASANPMAIEYSYF